MDRFCTAVAQSCATRVQQPLVSAVALAIVEEVLARNPCQKGDLLVRTFMRKISHEQPYFFSEGTFVNLQFAVVGRDRSVLACNFMSEH